MTGPAGDRPEMLYSVEEAASLLGIGRTYMFRLVATGAIESLKIGKRRRIPRGAINAFIDRLLEEHASPADHGLVQPPTPPSYRPK